jgi:hypothetical protein
VIKSTAKFGVHQLYYLLSIQSQKGVHQILFFFFFQSVLHDWDHDDCVKILKNCKKAIPPREAGGKVIIINMVVGAGPSEMKHKEMQAIFDVYIMFINGMERDEQEWSKIFSEAGYSDYRIIPVLGVRSIIEVYP